MAIAPDALPAVALEFLTERHLATLTTLRSDGSPHVVPVGFTWDPEALVARVITSRGSSKVLHVRAADVAGAPATAVLCQVDGRRWLSIEGTLSVHEDEPAVRDAEQRYAARYRAPRPNPERVVLVLAVTRILGDSTVITPGS